jgi:hypothetical protein
MSVGRLKCPLGLKKGCGIDKGRCKTLKKKCGIDKDRCKTLKKWQTWCREEEGVRPLLSQKPRQNRKKLTGIGRLVLKKPANSVSLHEDVAGGRRSG